GSEISSNRRPQRSYNARWKPSRSQSNCGPHSSLMPSPLGVKALGKKKGQRQLRVKTCRESRTRQPFDRSTSALTSSTSAAKKRLPLEPSCQKIDTTSVVSIESITLSPSQIERSGPRSS